jgi:uncharacterized LabA/DUF88 family protein
MLKMGIYIDHENIRLSGGSDVDFEILLKYLREGHYLLRACVYTVVDYAQPEDLQDKLHRYRDKLRHIGYKVLEKERRSFVDPETGEKSSKSNTDMELAIDVLREIDNLDVVVVVSGDGDFKRLVEAVQSRGRQVWVVAFENISKDLKEAADRFVNGSDIAGIRRERERSASRF